MATEQEIRQMMGRVIRDQILADALAKASGADEFEKILNNNGVALTYDQKAAVAKNLDVLRKAAQTLDFSKVQRIPS
jgi:hypothetical protein